MKQLNHIKGSEAKHSEQKQELTDIENQLTTLQNRLVEIQQILSTDFGLGMAQQDVSSSLEQQSFSPAKRGDGKIHKLRAQAEAKEARIKKAEEKLAN